MKEEGEVEVEVEASTQQQQEQQEPVAPLPTMGAMLAQLQVELELRSDAQLAQLESAAAAFNYAPDPSLTRRQRTVALWKEIVQHQQ